MTYFLESHGYAALGMEVNDKLTIRNFMDQRGTVSYPDVSCKAALLHFYGNYSYGGTDPSSSLRN